MLVVQHDIHRVLGFSRRVTVMNQGDVLTTGTPDAVRTDRRVQEIYTGTGVPPSTLRASSQAGEKHILRFAARAMLPFSGKSHILNDATLDVREGEIVALLGPQRRRQVAFPLKTLRRSGAAGIRNRSCSRICN